MLELHGHMRQATCIRCYEQVPVDPMAGPLAAVGKIKQEPTALSKKIFWSILIGMFAAWVVLIIVWTGGSRSKGYTGLTNAPADGPIDFHLNGKLN